MVTPLSWKLIKMFHFQIVILKSIKMHNIISTVLKCTCLGWGKNTREKCFQMHQLQLCRAGIIKIFLFWNFQVFHRGYPYDFS